MTTLVHPYQWIFKTIIWCLQPPPDSTANYKIGGSSKIRMGSRSFSTGSWWYLRCCRSTIRGHWLHRRREIDILFISVLEGLLFAHSEHIAFVTPPETQYDTRSAKHVIIMSIVTDHRNNHIVTWLLANSNCFYDQIHNVATWTSIQCKPHSIQRQNRLEIPLSMWCTPNSKATALTF